MANAETMRGTLLVPMAGRGMRFHNAGCDIPKQLINVGGIDMIDWSLSCIDYFGCDVVFIIRRDTVERFSMDEVLREKFGCDIKIVVAESDTDGTVCSCLLAKEFINNDKPLAITTLDVVFKPVFKISEIRTDIDGCILTFDSLNPAYSYSKIGEDGFVSETAEKKVISNKASAGLYSFSKGNVFVEYAEKMIRAGLRTNGEFYVAPLYNLLIEDGLKIATSDVSDIGMMGTPEELENFLKNDLKRYEKI